MLAEISTSFARKEILRFKVPAPLKCENIPLHSHQGDTSREIKTERFVYVFEGFCIEVALRCTTERPGTKNTDTPKKLRAQTRQLGEGGVPSENKNISQDERNDDDCEGSVKLEKFHSNLQLLLSMTL